MKLHPNARTTPKSRAILVRRILEEGWLVKEAAKAAGICRQTVWKWIRRFLQEGVEGLEDRSSAPHLIPHRTPARTVVRVRKLRRLKRTAWQIAEALGMAWSTVSAWLRRMNLGRLKNLEPREVPVRYEREHPGELLHLDIKKFGKIGGCVGWRIHGDRRARVRGAGWECVHVCVDDASRAAYAEVLPNERKESAVDFLRRAVDWYEKRGVTVQAVMTDNGSAYVSHAFRDACAELGLRHLRTRPYRPQTNGKAERFIQTLQREWAYAVAYETSKQRARALRPWLDHYNHCRPHSALGHRAPVVLLPGTRRQPT